MSLTNFSTLKIYRSKSGKKWELEKDKNFMIGNYAIAEYLALNWNDAYLQVNNFQYIKHQLELDIKVDLSQSYSQPLQQYGYKYISIQNNGDTRIYYYFITNTEWRSENVVRFHLVMDTLNTFKYMSDYSVGNKTLILREHKDRFKEYTQHVDSKTISFFALEDDDEIDVVVKVDTNKKVDTESITFSNLDPTIRDMDFSHLDTEGNIVFHVKLDSHQDGYFTFDIAWDYSCLRRIIDLKSEDITPALYKVAEQELTDGSNTSWSLLYKNDNAIDTSKYYQVNPVSCYIVPKDEISVKIVSPEITNAIVGLNGKYFVEYFNSEPLTFNINNGAYTFTTPKIRTNFAGGKYTRGIEFRLSGGNMQYRIFVCNCFIDDPTDSGDYAIVKNWTTFTSCKIMNTLQTINAHSGSAENSNIKTLLKGEMGTDYSYTYTPSSPQTLSADNIDRTDSKNIKIITLPYCPTTIEISGNDLIFSSLWTYDNDEAKLKLNNVRTQFNATFTNELSVFGELYVKDTLDPTTTRSEHLESKLYNSAFYQPKFVYDSFNKYFELENMLEVEDSTKFITNFVASRNIVSKFMFSFPQYTLERSLSDYDNAVLVGRNNEEVLYTSAYIDYIKTGFNYDQKAKERNAVVGGISLGLQGIATAGTIAGSIATSNPIGIAAGVGMATGLAASIVSYTKSVVDNDISISRKLDEAKRQAVSVSSVDDVDLLTAYSNNKAKICFYQPTEEVRQALFNLFYYCGYVRNIQGQPNINSRCWFNFVQAELEIDDGYNMSEEIINDIKYKFSMGVTFFHKYGGNYDLSQTKENVETNLL